MITKNIAENITFIKKRIKIVAERCGRKAENIMFLGVTKTHPAETLDEALAGGLEYIAENKIQESEDKLPVLTQPYKEFHFIGHLQSNKIKKLMPLNPALIHSIDKLSTAKKLDAYCSTKGIVQNILVQINTSAEESKFGIEPADAEEFVREVAKLENLQIKGLMTIGMFTDDMEAVRNCFKMLKNIQTDIIRLDIPRVEMKHLSMGMTNDFEIAIEEGASIVRVGSAIFGARDYSTKN